jgi:ATP synthase protein I
MTKDPHHTEEPLPRIVDKKTRKRLWTRGDRDRTLFFGFGMFGMVGWSIAIPAVLGTILGRWLDARNVGPATVSWTLTCLVAGLATGAFIAWRWVSRESK